MDTIKPEAKEFYRYDPCAVRHPLLEYHRAMSLRTSLAGLTKFAAAFGNRGRQNSRLSSARSIRERRTCRRVPKCPVLSEFFRDDKGTSCGRYGESLDRPSACAGMAKRFPLYIGPGGESFGRVFSESADFLNLFVRRSLSLLRRLCHRFQYRATLLQKALKMSRQQQSLGKPTKRSEWRFKTHDVHHYRAAILGRLEMMIMLQKFEGAADHAILKIGRPIESGYAAGESLCYPEMACLPHDLFAEVEQSRGPTTDGRLSASARGLYMGVHAAGEIETTGCR